MSEFERHDEQMHHGQSFSDNSAIDNSAIDNSTVDNSAVDGGSSGPLSATAVFAPESEVSGESSQRSFGGHPEDGDMQDENDNRTSTISSDHDGIIEAGGGFFTRIGNWFRGSTHGESISGIGASVPEQHIVDRVRPAGNGTAIETRTSFLRPWAKRDAAIQNLQEGFHTVTDLMTTVRDHLREQGQRQNELIGYLAHLPEALQQLPETNRIHGEALKAIHQQLAGQNDNQERLSAILEKLNAKGLENREVLDEVRERVETMRQTDQAIADNLSSVGGAMATISKSGETTSQVLEQMRDNLDSRDGQLERILHKQAARFTTMLSVAIFLSIAALAAVCIMGYQVMQAKH